MLCRACKISGQMPTECNVRACVMCENAYIMQCANAMCENAYRMQCANAMCECNVRAECLQNAMCENAYRMQGQGCNECALCDDCMQHNRYSQQAARWKAQGDTPQHDT
jgi:hypothetical protein